MKIGKTLKGIRNRLLQFMALYAPGAFTLRVRLHRARGVTLGDGCFIGTSVLLENHRPELIQVGREVTFSMRVMVIAHFREIGSFHAHENPLGDINAPTVIIGDEVFIGPGAIILPNVRIGDGAVVTAGSVVSADVDAGIMVTGNPAEPVARCTRPLICATRYKEFVAGLRPLR